MAPGYADNSPNSRLRSPGQLPRDLLGIPREPTAEEPARLEEAEGPTWVRGCPRCKGPQDGPACPPTGSRELKRPALQVESGFAVGSTIRRDGRAGRKSGTLDREPAAANMTARYTSFIYSYESAAS